MQRQRTVIIPHTIEESQHYDNRIDSNHKSISLYATIDDKVPGGKRMQESNAYQFSFELIEVTMELIIFSQS